MKRLVVPLGVAVALLVVGCGDGSTAHSEQQSTSTALSTVSTPSSATTTKLPEGDDDHVAVSFQGTVSYKTFEGGFFAIDGDDGNGYDPINLPDEYAVDGLRVQVSALIRDDLASFHMWGSIVEIVEITGL
jgi:lipopolysaccharide export LptBFGC system permease protein LptF